MHDIKLNLAVDDVNLILEALGNLPFARVYTLIGKIQDQAARQIDTERTSPTQIAAVAGKTPTSK